MLLKNINFDSIVDYLHLERYVNKGSPSGFTEKFTTSLPTSAKGLNESYHLCGINFPSNVKMQDFGLKPFFFENWQLLVHPDMIFNPENNDLFSVCTEIDLNAVLVAPTASSRTVKVLDNEGWFLKLNYKGLIGRIDRNIGRNQALSAIEVSNIIVRTIDEGKLPDRFFFMREMFARVVELVDEGKPYEWGIVLREPFAYPNKSEIKFLIPAFSLFAMDDRNPTDPTILTQLIQRQGKTVQDFLFEDLIAPIFECYFQLLINCGLQLECHAQNTMVAVDEDFNIVGIVAKDAESIDKDISLMEELNIKQEFQIVKYKCLRKTDYNYQIMHSFMFDFKLGQYLVTPIIEDAAKNFQFDKTMLIQRIKKHNHTFVEKLPKDFFPLDGKWYDYENVVHDRTKPREYIPHDNPEFR